MSNLIPSSWIECNLGDVVTIVRGVTFPASSKVYEPTDGYIACLRTSHVQEKLLWNDIYYIPSSYVKSTERLAKRNDILMSMANSSNLVGKVCIKETDRDACFGAFLSAIRGEGVSHTYIYYFLKSNDTQQRLRSSASQTVNIANISVAALEKLSLPLPPLTEQTRIAAKIDALLTQVNTLKARIDGIPSLLKRFRQSVLAAAVSGRLTKNIDESELPPKWQLVNFSTVVNDLRYGTAQKCDYNGGETGVLRIPNIGDNGIKLKDLKSSRFSPSEINKLALKRGDVLLIRSNGSVELVGKSAVVGSREEGLLFAGYLIRIRPNHEKVSAKYINYWLKSPSVRQTIEMTARSTSGVNNINSEEIKALVFTMPPLSEQNDIVSRVEQLLALADRLEAKVASAQSRIDRLTQGILAKTFRGELVPQDPNDEPASVLLERIKAQRAAATNSKRGRRAATLG